MNLSSLQDLKVFQKMLMKYQKKGQKLLQGWRIQVY
jgi:hypothetical protein